MKCALQPEIAKKIIKNLYFGGSSLFKVVGVDKSKKSVTVLVMISSISICNCLHTRRANSGKITSFKGGTRLWLPRSILIYRCVRSIFGSDCSELLVFYYIRTVFSVFSTTLKSKKLQQHSVHNICLLYTSPSPRDRTRSRMPSSA